MRKRLKQAKDIKDTLRSCIEGLLWSLFLLALFLSTFVQAQSNSKITDSIVEQIHSLAENHPSQSIYIQTSKGIYETGEDLWFKAYVLDARFLNPSNLSKTLYVQVIQEESDEAVWQEKYEIMDGFVDGHIFLDDSLPEGDYLLSAYTSRSFLRGSEEFNDIRKIKIVEKTGNIKLSGLSPPVTKDNLIDLTLFPEGGNLISGLRSKLAFKAVDEHGNPVEVSGALYENNKPIVEFKSLHAGMGSIGFVPYGDKKYHVKLNQSDSTYYFPVIRRRGISMYLKEQDSTSMSFTISQSPETRARKIYLRVQVRGIVYSIAEGILKKSLKMKIPLKELPQGISEVTLFDENLRPVAERLVYVNPHRQLNIKASLLDGDEYTTKDKVTLKLKVTDGDGRPVIAHFGVTVYDWIYRNDQEPKNMMTHFYLSTQLKGSIHDPGYYFKKENKQRLEALDLLLLTQGWRRYVWSEANMNNISANRTPVILDGIHGEAINRKKNNSEILSQPVMMAYNPVNESQNDFVLLDSLGRFTITPEHLKIGERGYVYLRLMSPENSRFHFNLHDIGFKNIDEVRRSKVSVCPMPPLKSNAYDNSEPFRSVPEMVQLDEVELRARKRKVTREKYLGKLDSLAKLELTNDYICKHNYLNCPVCIGDEDNKKPTEGDIYQELQLWDENRKMYVKANEGPRPNQLFRNPSLAPYKYPKLTDAELMNLYKMVRIKGYYGHREFYQPNYDNEDSSFLDFRNTLLWNPSVITNTNGEAKLEFYCSDINTLFIGVIEGVSGGGLLGNENFEFTVRK